MPYFHLVAIVLDALNALFLQNQDALDDLLFQSVASSLVEVTADPRHFPLHVLPRCFVCICSYGLLANRNRTENLAHCRACGQGRRAPASEIQPNARPHGLRGPRHETSSNRH